MAYTIKVAHHYVMWQDVETELLTVEGGEPSLHLVRRNGLFALGFIHGYLRGKQATTGEKP